MELIQLSENSSNTNNTTPVTVDDNINTTTTVNTFDFTMDSYWKEYLLTTSKEYNEKIKKIAALGVYEFEFVEGPKIGKKQTYQRLKISVRQMLELEQMRAKYAQVNKSNSSRSEAELLLASIYAKCAKYYFGIEEEDFFSMDYETSKPNIDASAHISAYGRPKSA